MSGAEAFNIEPHLIRIIDQISSDDKIWFDDIDKFLLAGIMPENGSETVSGLQYKY